MSPARWAARWGSRAVQVPRPQEPHRRSGIRAGSLQTRSFLHTTCPPRPGVKPLTQVQRPRLQSI